MPGIIASIREIGQPCATSSRVCLSQACRSTSFIFAVRSSVAMVTKARPPPGCPRSARFCCGGLRPDGPLDDVGVDLDPAGAREGYPAGAWDLEKRDENSLLLKSI